MYCIKKEMTSLESAVLLIPEKIEDPRTCQYDHRILLLSGFWEKPKCRAKLQGSIYVFSNGSADGIINWQVLLQHGTKLNVFGREKVNGFVIGNDVELDGYESDFTIYTDNYKMHLVGGEAGVFGGKSLTRERNWSGTLEGNYQFKNRKA